MNFECVEYEHGVAILTDRGLSIPETRAVFALFEDRDLDFLALDLAEHYGALFVATKKSCVDEWRGSLGLPLGAEIPPRQVSMVVGVEPAGDTLGDRTAAGLLAGALRSELIWMTSPPERRWQDHPDYPGGKVSVFDYHSDGHLWGRCSPMAVRCVYCKVIGQHVDSIVDSVCEKRLELRESS